MVAPIYAANRLPVNSNVMYAKPTTVCFEASVTSAAAWCLPLPAQERKA